MLHRADRADLRIAPPQLAFGIQDRVDVEFGCFWLAGKFTKSLDEFLLKIVGEVVLLPEEDDTTLRDCSVGEPDFITRR